MRTLDKLTAATLCLAVLCGSTAAQTRFDDWELVCKAPQQAPQSQAQKSNDQPPGCRLQQAQAVNGGKDVVFLFNVAIQNKRPVAIISTPLNVYLPAGIDLKIDSGRTQKAAFETCNLSGCHGGFVINDQLLGSFKRGQQLTVTIRDSKSTQIPIKVSLKGISSGIKALQEVQP